MARARPKLRPALAGLVFLVAAVVAVAAAVRAVPLLYLFYIGVSLLLGAICWTNLVWMMHVWRTPRSLVESRLDGDDRTPEHSFSLIVPARHEDAVLGATLSRLLATDHPAFEVLVVVGSDDPATRNVAERIAERYPARVRVVEDVSWPKNKPRALNAALPYCTGTITGVLDAEDDVHPELLRRVDQRFQSTDADVVQAGVQLMNFRSSWLTVRNVLEYYFWFRSRLHFQASQGFIPLGGNTVFIRTEVVRAVSGWDPECLAEDCELGVRLSALGARTVVFYEPELVTREECPPTLGAFARQRTRWNQGYLQTFFKGDWRSLRPRQRALGAYVLAMPYLLALAWLVIPVAIATAVAVKAPIVITLVSFVPAIPMLAVLAVELAALGEFCRTYGERSSPRDYARLVFGLPVYQAVLAFAAARAAAREARGARGWEKTAHLGLHLGDRRQETAAETNGSELASARDRVRLAGSIKCPPEPREPEPAVAHSAGPHPRFAERAMSLRQARPTRAVEMHHAELGSGRLIDFSEDSPFRDQVAAMTNGRSAAAGNGHGASPLRATNGDRAWPDRARNGSAAAIASEPLWLRLHRLWATGSASLPLPGVADPAALRGRRLRDAGALLRNVVMSHADLALVLVLLAVVGAVEATNMLHWPATQFDEGTYVGEAWAIQHGALAPYTFSYGHPPLAWMLIFLWTSIGRIFGHGSYSIDGAREFMLIVNLASCSLLYMLARRLSFSRVAAAAAVLLFALSPLALFYHRAVLLDNPAITFMLAAFVLALTPERRLWAFAASGACFAASVLCKETTFVFLPALLLAAAQNTDRLTRRYCLTLLVAFLVVTGLFYPLYAAVKGELVPGHGHVSLIGYAIVQLFTRKGTGSLFDPHSQTHVIVTAWLKLDPWLLAAALTLAPIALARRSTRAVALAFLIQLGLVLRPGYLPNMYVIGFLPFAALMVTGSIEALWRRWRLIPSRPPAWLLAAIIGTAAFALAPNVAGRWIQGDKIAVTTRVDGPTRTAESWLVHHVGHDKRLIVGDEFWLYLIGHGFDHQAQRGGFFSRTVVSYWPLDYDPAVKRRFPDGWRNFDYVISTEAVRGGLKQTPTTAAAIDHSRVLVTFGSGAGRVEIRAITGR